MPPLQQRLAALRPTIEHIMTIVGTAGLSYGVIHNGHVVHTDNFDYRDVANKTPPNDQTIYPICSMTKGLVSSLLAMVIEEQSPNLDWSSKVADLLPEYDREPRPDTHDLTLADWMSMRSGTESYQPWFQSHNNIIFDPADELRIVNALAQVRGARSRFQYSNWGYAIAARVLERATGRTWADLFHARVLQPLDLVRTDAKGDVANFTNVAESYTTLDDATPFHIPRTPISGRTLLGAAGGISSCVSDFLTLYRSILSAASDQFTRHARSTPDSIFKRLNETMSAHIPMAGPSLNESSYALGWQRTQLPNVMCKTSSNYVRLGPRDTPVLGEGGASRLQISHYGAMPGAQCGVNMYPETGSVVVLLTNSTGMCDVPNWVMQCITQEVFNVPVKHDYMEWTRRTVDMELDWQPSLVRQLERERTPGTCPRGLEAYVGHYVNKAGYFKISIALREGSLTMALQGREDETFTLRHYEYDTFCWLESRDARVKRGRWTGQPAGYYLIKFHGAEGGGITRLSWMNDAEVPEGESFYKSS